MATVDDKKIIFSMVGVSKIIPQNRKQILKDIYLSFFYGAKIGIIGLNGAGKSTLMKIIAGLEQPTQGDVVWSPGYTVGYLPQDPPLNEQKTVKENVMEGVQKVYDALAEYEEINRKFGEEEYRQNQVDGGKDYIVHHGLDLTGCRLPCAFHRAGHIAGTGSEGRGSHHADQQQGQHQCRTKAFAFCVVHRFLRFYRCFAGAICHSSQRFPRMVTLSVRFMESIPAGVQQSRSHV